MHTHKKLLQLLSASRASGKNVSVSARKDLVLARSDSNSRPISTVVGKYQTTDKSAYCETERMPQLANANQTSIKTRQGQWRNWRVGQGGEPPPPWQAKYKNWTPLADILIFSNLLFSVGFYFFRGVFVLFFLSSIDIHDIRILFQLFF